MDVERARYNMIEQQIRTWGVLEQGILASLLVVRREDFVPPEMRSMAFVDMDVPLVLDGKPTGETMFAPKTEARLLQELAIRPVETVLEIGAGSGHMAAMLAQRARHVVTLEIHPGLARFAQANLARARIDDVEVRQADGSRPEALVGGYDVILLSGSVSQVPDFVLKAVNPGGRIAAIVGELPVMRAQIIERVGEASWNARTVFETVALPLHGFPVRERFSF
jgi:protein-L-isoaspartate(D-aspartate) O-methyltransferase